MENEKKNKGGRPKKEEKEKKTCSVTIRLTEDDLDDLNEMAYYYKISRSELVSSLVKKNKIFVRW